MSTGFTEKQLQELFDDFTFLSMVDYYFNTADIDHSGFIEKGEVHKFLTKFAEEKRVDPPSNKEINETLRKFDTNKDGKLSKKEFEFLIKKCIREMLSLK